MLDQIKKLTSGANYFLENRWDNPLHTPAATEMQNCLWPSSDDFYHPLNPMFSCFLVQEKQMSSYDVILLRDGAHMLLDFYFRFPTPKKSKTIYFVAADLYFLVPLAWRAQTFAYRLSNEVKTITNKLAMFALINETFLSWHRNRHHMQDWLKQFNPESEVSAYFVIRNEPINHQWTDKTIAFEFTSTLQRHFKKPIEFLNYENFKKQGGNSQATFVSLDTLRTGIGLCSLENLFLGQGIHVFPRKTYKAFNGEKLGDWPMSFNHKLQLFKGECPHADFEPLLFLKKMNAYPIIPRMLDTIAERINL